MAPKPSNTQPDQSTAGAVPLRGLSTGREAGRYLRSERLSVAVANLRVMSQLESRRYQFDQSGPKQRVRDAMAAVETRGYYTRFRDKLGAWTVVVEGREPARLDALMSGFGGEPILSEDNA